MESILDKIDKQLKVLEEEITNVINNRIKTPLTDPLTRRELGDKILRLKGERKGLNWVIENFTRLP